MSRAHADASNGAVADPPLLRLEEARAHMLAGVRALPAEWVTLERALGRVLAEPLDTQVSLPPWDNSAMDGFALRAADVSGASLGEPIVLEVIGEVPAGHAPDVGVTPGTAIRVFTGALMPPGADAVVPVEDTDAPRGLAARPDRVAIHQGAATGAHIRLAGEDVRAGERILPAGVTVSPARLALAAATGHGELLVHRRPRVAVLATGDELVPAGRPLGAAGIHDSNSVSLAAQVRAAGAKPVRLGLARDRSEEVVARLREGVAVADMVIASGGVSVGAHDVVKDAFGAVGTLDLWRVAVQPGKPVAFGHAKRARGQGGDGGSDEQAVLLFGLPGNPVSTFVTFEIFVRPVLRRLAGHADATGRMLIRAELVEPITKSPGRRAFLRVRLEPDPDRATGWRATLSGGQGSHVISALAEANGLAVVPEEVDSLPSGALVDVVVLDEGAS